MYTKPFIFTEVSQFASSITSHNFPESNLELITKTMASMNKVESLKPTHSNTIVPNVVKQQLDLRRNSISITLPYHLLEKYFEKA